MKTLKECILTNFVEVETSVECMDTAIKTTQTCVHATKKLHQFEKKLGTSVQVSYTDSKTFRDADLNRKLHCNF